MLRCLTRPKLTFVGDKLVTYTAGSKASFFSFFFFFTSTTFGLMGNFCLSVSWEFGSCAHTHTLTQTHTQTMSTTALSRRDIVWIWNMWSKENTTLSTIRRRHLAPFYCKSSNQKSYEHSTRCRTVLSCHGALLRLPWDSACPNHNNSTGENHK